MSTAAPPIPSAPAPEPETARASRLVLAVFGLLALTVLEVIVVGLPVDRTARITALCALAMTQALVVLTAFLRIGRESRIIRLALLAPFVFAPTFTVALMLDAAFRVTQR
jgi:heme/copper-type cytochrome/quinol oxidase subunit 4